VPASFSPTLLLAGPILRKVTPAAVSVWVAASRPCTVFLDVYGSPATLNMGADPQVGKVDAEQVGSGTIDTVRVGRSLHVAVVTAPVAGVPPDTVCSYNVTLGVNPGEAPPDGAFKWQGSWDLGGLKLLDLGDPSADYQGGLGYAAGRLPTFPTPPADASGLRIWHGSCFKLHGIGLSAMANLDDMLSDTLPADATAQKQRPHLLILTGDQIYADEVATPLIPHITQIGANLLGTAETIPVPGSNDGHVAVTQANFPAGRRQRLVRVTGGMSTDEGPNHLIGFGEWAAMYLLSWSGRLEGRLLDQTKPVWPDKGTLAMLPPASGQPQNPPGVPTVLDPKGALSPIDSLLTPIFTTPAAKLLQKLRDEFPQQRDDVEKAGDDGDKIRRALANIPVLTICDDHEVTDDWFMTGAWRSKVLASDFGRAMVRNALLAYVLFQAWGNTPEAFAQAGTPEAQLLALVPKLFPSSAGGAGAATPPETPDAATCKSVDSLLGLDDPTGLGDPTGTGPSKRVAFHYHVDLAGARLVVLDTRTHREYVTPNGPPGLLTAAALDAQLPIALTDDVPLLIVVSPCPVLGPRLIEEALDPLVTRAYEVYHLAFRNAAKAAAAGYDTKIPFADLWNDLEQWSARPPAFERLLQRLSRCPQVVILAGDVHYAASFAMDYQRFDVPAADGGVPSLDPPPRSPTSRIVHFTASAIRNQWEFRVPAFAASVGLTENLEQLGFDGIRLGWTRMTPPILTGGDEAAGEARVLRARLHREPVVLPTIGWTAPHAVRAPEWAYRVQPLVDGRTDEVRFASLRTAGFTQVLGPSVPDASMPPPDGSTTASLVDAGGPYSIATALHAANVDGGAVTRTLVFQNNIGVVTFSRSSEGAPLGVQMALFFVRAHPASEDEKPHDYVVHAASLAPNPIAAPAEVGEPPKPPSGGS
jgi:hypothetical protein